MRQEGIARSYIQPSSQSITNLTGKYPEGYLVKKAYQIDMDRLDEGYLADVIFCHAKNINFAKVELLKSVRYDGWKLKYTGEELNYLNIPVIRRRESDIVIFEGQEVVRCKIESIKEERERTEKLDEILNTRDCHNLSKNPRMLFLNLFGQLSIGQLRSSYHQDYQKRCIGLHY